MTGVLRRRGVESKPKPRSVVMAGYVNSAELIKKSGTFPLKGGKEPL